MLFEQGDNRQGNKITIELLSMYAIIFHLPHIGYFDGLFLILDLFFSALFSCNLYSTDLVLKQSM